MSSTTRGRGGRGWAPEPPATGAAAQDAEPDHESVARSIALRMLTGAARSRKQLAEAMARKGVDDETSARVLDRFEEVGLVDDAAYAAAFVRSRHAERGLARRALALELRRRGIAAEHAEQALAEVSDDQEQLRAEELARARWQALAGHDDEVRTRRVVGLLGRKGYSPGLALRLVRSMRDDGDDTFA